MNAIKKGFLLWMTAMLWIATAVPDPARSQEVIRIAGDNNFPPFEYYADSGVYSGFNVDIMNAISLETGLKFEYLPLPWNEAIKALNRGEVDALQGMKYSPARDKIYDFSDSYFTSSQGIFVRKQNLSIFHIEDLNGRKVAVQKGDIAQDLLRELHDTVFVETKSQEEALELLLKGDVDAFVGNRITGQYFLQKSNHQADVKIVGDPIDPTAYGVAVLPANRELLEKLNEGIKAIKQNGTYGKIERKWFGEYVLPRSLDLDRILPYLQGAMLLVLLVVIGILWWNRLLKKEVRKRTLQIDEMNKSLKEKMLLLEENVQTQQQLLDSAYSCYVTLNKYSHISLMNRLAIDYLGLKNPLVGFPISGTILAKFIPVEQINDVLQQGKTYLEQEVVWERLGEKTEDPRVIRYNILPLYAKEREVIGAIIPFQDVTRQKEIEKKLESEARLRSLGQLILGIAHEIRNPLTSILTYTQMLPTKFDNPKFREFFARHVPSEILRLNGLVHDLLDYARPKPPQPTRFSASAEIEGVLQLCSKKIRDMKIQVRQEIDPSLCIFADVNQTKQILINIILNAVESMEQGGKLSIRGYSRSQWAVLEIEDNGKGISPEEKYLIFEPFFTTKANGAGLGLSITYQLIKENNGMIHIHSQPGKGTTMEILLPLPQDEEGNDSNAEADTARD